MPTRTAAVRERGWRGSASSHDEFHQLVLTDPCWNYHGAIAARAGARRFVFEEGGFGFADDMDPALLEAMRRRGKVARETSVACHTVAG